MNAKFKTLSFNAAVAPSAESMATPLRLMGALSSDVESEDSRSILASLGSDETAARYYAEQLLQASGDAELEPVVAPAESDVVPGLALDRSEELAAAGTRTLHFEQQSGSVPIFDTNAVVEIEVGTRRLVSFDAHLANAPDVPPVAALSPREALKGLTSVTGAELGLDEVQAPRLYYFAETEGGDWHLAYLFKNIPAAPREVAAARSEGQGGGHGLGPSPREDFVHFNYLVDANSGETLYYYSAQPAVDVPTPCHGLDELGNSRNFLGRFNGNGFEMHDPLRNIETYDHGLDDIQAPPPAAPISSASDNFGTSSTAGVSAHANASLVFDFFNNVLKRNGIDGKGMRLISLVNCTYSGHGGGDSWRNAVWWNKRMWYGQTRRPSGNGFDSYARHLDVIAHELSHGITESTSDLVYRDEPGALNESFSDIFGVMIANWYPGEPNPLSGWRWEIGAGLASGGGPLRDMSDPRRTGDPDHWNDRKHLGTAVDNGGVHVNSNIHNKAAYNLLTATDATGNPVLTPEEIALLYYLTLTRLSRRATFKDCLRVLRSVAASYFRGNPNSAAAARRAIDDAYSAVGIV